MADGGVIPDARAWALVQRAVRQVLGEWFGGDGGPPGGDFLGGAPGGSQRFLFCSLAGSLAAGGAVNGSVLKWTGSGWSSTGETIQVRDWRDAGNAIASGRRCVCVYQFGAWWVVSTRC